MDISTFNRAKAAYDARDWETAAILFSACTEGPGSGEACHLRGNALMRMGRVQDAVEAYTKAIGDPTYTNIGAIYTNLGKAQVAIGDYTGAVESLRRALEDTSYQGAYKAWLALGGAFSRLGDARSAGIAYRKAALEANNPDPAKALINLGVCFVQMRRPEDAASAYRTALDFSQDANERNMILSNLGQAYVAANRMVEAVQSFEEAVADGYQLLPPAQADYERAKAAATSLAGTVTGDRSAGSTANLIASLGSGNASVDPLDPLGRSGEVMPSPEQSGFFTLTDDQIEAQGKKAIKAERRQDGQRTGLKVALVAVIVLVALLAVAVVAFLVMGIGVPSQESSINSVFTAAESGNYTASGWASGTTETDRQAQLASVTRGSSHDVQGLDYSLASPSDSTAYVLVTLPEGGTVEYDVTLVRDGIGWKVSEANEAHSSVDASTFSGTDAAAVAPVADATVAEAPVADAPVVDAPEAEVPETEIPEGENPEAEIPEGEPVPDEAPVE